MTTKVAVVGATGKLGRLIADIVEDSAEFELVASLDSRSPLEEMLAAELVVDVTVPGVSQKVVEFAVANGRQVLVGTSGWSADRLKGLRRLLGDPPASGVVVVPNFSLGSVLATSFAAMAARFYDSIEIIEAHASTKVDSPSGTAVRTAELMGDARAAIGPVSAPHTDQRARGQQVASIPIHSLRLAGVVAKQDVVFGGTGEVLTITHETISPTAYATGIGVALRAAVSARGVVVGLDKLIDLDGRGVAPTGEGAVADGAGPATGPENVSGQAAGATSVNP
ncbi:4-hydroxy-tetrahydrodipicolinate reductase [Herbiconiux sp. CPCC 203407]|uniref:4-hydroxy-tetrahydrodipicolinate reductase n=1 Tax=Herbiconiux oxytropis TaxID=2970915 RepID=A0AA41XH39_9MICO|nr:4-hydroxy-tetrahydrodipicolinate reductase [Herbiconiux oxytropis]MCS5720546.1 4-hydroxy-tetrahydrodipicolinate reductase [Herbiconiux oxytropis]MCS5726119.1 4-hydroxy-tetrahydrodipicolinate reductase [Herbiconiux oxytropis]